MFRRTAKCTSTAAIIGCPIIAILNVRPLFCLFCYVISFRVHPVYNEPELANDTAAYVHIANTGLTCQCSQCGLKLQFMMETSKNYAGPRANENGDEIVFEGIRDPKMICSLVLLWIIYYHSVSCCCSSRASLRFFIAFYSESGVCTSLTANFITALGLTPFSDINLISVVPGTNTVLVGRKQGQFKLRISGVVNCKEFVAAVKAEMAHSQQQ